MCSRPRVEMLYDPSVVEMSEGEGRVGPGVLCMSGAA